MSVGQGGTGGDDERQHEREREIRVLHLDDEAGFVEMAAEMIERAGDRIEVVPTTDPEEALDRLAEESFDCVVSDYQMPGTTGLEFLRRVRDEYPDLPFLLFTGKGSEELAGEAISAGVTDYLQKESGTEQYTVLANRIENTVTQYRAQRRVEETNRRIRQVHERITDAVVAIDEEWEYTYLNRQAEELLQREETELLGGTVWEAFPALEGSAFETALREAMESQETRTAEAYFDPLDVWFEVRAFPDEGGLSIYFRDVSERRERERRYEAIFNNTFQFTGLLEPDGTLLEANDTALEFGGLDRGDVVGQKVWDAHWFQISGETRESAREAVERAAEGEFVRQELEVQGADGPAVIDFSVRPIIDETGEVTLLVPEGRDITELKRREEELREERAFTESLFSALPDVLYAFDGDGQFLRWNDRLAEVTGYTDEEIAGMHPIDFVPEEDAEEIAAGIAAVVEDRETVTVEGHFETKDGEQLPYEFTGAPLTDVDGEFLGLVGIGRNISERRERERRYEAIFNQTFQFTGLLEPDGTLLEANDTALEFGGLDREDVVGRKVWEAHWFQVSEETRESAREAVERAAEGEFVRQELEVQGAEGPVVIDFSIKPITDEDGEVVLLVPEGRDITALKERERELERQNQRLEEFASVVSHDLRNPLTVAKGNVSLVEETGDLDRLERVERALDRMDDLIEKLLALAEQGQVVDEPVPADLGETVEEAVASAVRSEVSVAVECPPDAVVRADRGRFVELVENLLANAVEHGSPESGGGDVSIRIGLDGDTLYVADDGPGVPPEEREDVFTPGRSTSENGNGFGLSIVRSIARAHGWTVGVTESAEGGARFEIRGLELV